MTKKKMKVLLLLMSIVLLAACCLANWAGEETPMYDEYPNTWVIQRGGALNLRDVGQGLVGIGYADTDWKKYIDEQGKTRRRYVAWLDMVTAEPSSDGPSSRQVVDVHAGQEFAFGGYNIKVLEIWACQKAIINAGPCIRLQILPQEPQEQFAP